MEYGCGVLAGVVSACILAFALAHAGSVLILAVYAASIPLFMAGLGAGFAPALVAALVGTVALAVKEPSSFSVFYVIADAMPALLFVFIALRRRIASDGQIVWQSEGHLLAAFAVYPCIIFLAIVVAMAGHDGGLLNMTQHAFDSVTDQVNGMLAENGQDVSPDITLRVQGYVAFFARIAPALGMCAWLFSTLIAMGAAQMLLRQKQWNLRPSFELTHLHVPNWVIFAAAATGVMGSIAPAPYDYVGLNLSVILGIPFFFTGLAVIHAWAAQTRHPTLALCVFYILISVIVHLVLLVALVGAVDQWVDFRKRFAERPKV